MPGVRASVVAQLAPWLAPRPMKISEEAMKDARVLWKEADEPEQHLRSGMLFMFDDGIGGCTDGAKKLLSTSAPPPWPGLARVVVPVAARADRAD